jgi:hypothetical protein
MPLALDCLLESWFPHRWVVEPPHDRCDRCDRCDLSDLLAPGWQLCRLISEYIPPHADKHIARPEIWIQDDITGISIVLLTVTLSLCILMP